MLTIELSDTIADLEQIIALQKVNLSTAVAADLWQAQGFLTMEYTVAQLLKISGKYRHALAKDGDVVVGYALIMLKEEKADFPFLHDMFEAIDGGRFQGVPLRGRRYVVMGQVCIAGAYRGRGIFTMLYATLRQQMRADFELLVTEVSFKNPRSRQAHQRVGFRSIEVQDGDASAWDVIAWDWN